MKFLKLLTIIIICQLAGIIGSFFTIPAIEGWYASLQKPFFTPPRWLFGPAWTTLYFLMGLSFYIISERINFQENKKAFILFALQLLLNSLWSIIFFGLKLPGAAFAELVVLWILILLMTIEFFKIEAKAGWLILPYLLWVSFAGILNLSITLLN